MLYMVQDILDYSLLESNQLILHPSLFSVSQILEDSIGLFKQLAKDKKIWLYFNYDSSAGSGTGLPEKIRTDPGRFQKMLIKILSVSIKYTERGHIRVSAQKIVEEATGQAKIKFIIEDTGVGMTNG